MPTVGAFARVEIDDAEATRQRLSELDGVTPFDLDETGKVGLLIEAPDLDAAHNTLTEVVKPTAGVLAVWPVYVDVEDMSVEE